MDAFRENEKLDTLSDGPRAASVTCEQLPSSPRVWRFVKFGLPKGSLESPTLELMRKAGWRVSVDGRSYVPGTDDSELACRLMRPQEMPRYIAEGTLDAGITGHDWIVETESDVVEVAHFLYAKMSLCPTKWLLVVHRDSPVQALEDLQGKRIATEMVRFTERLLATRKVRAEVEFSWGATEGKVADGLVDAAVEVSETGQSLRSNGLRVVEELLTSTPRLVANKEAWLDRWKRAKIEQIALLLRAAFDAESRVGLKLNVAHHHLNEIMDLLPSVTSPTVSYLYPPPGADTEWFAVETVISEHQVREIVPKLVKAGAVGIIEYPLNKILSH